MIIDPSDIHRYSQIFIDIHRYSQISTDIHRYLSSSYMGYWGYIDGARYPIVPLFDYTLPPHC